MSNQQAFPHKEAMNQSGYGMTLRDYFAGQALPAVIAATQGGNVAVLAVDAFAMADAMLAEREKKS